MTSVDINKWIAGEIEAFFDPPITPPPVVADRNPGEERSATQSSKRKFSYTAIAAIVAALAFVGSASIVVSMRYLDSPSTAADTKSPSSETPTASGGIKDAAPATPGAPPTPALPPTPAAPPPTETVATAAPPIVNPPAIHPDPQRATFLNDVGAWYDQHTNAVRIPQRKPVPAQRASSRHWPRYSSHVDADSGEATRLMVDELRQRGVAVGNALRPVDPR
jgi:hypothetical protein